MTREIDIATLDNAGVDYAVWFTANRAPLDRNYVMRMFYNFTFKDEFEYMIDAVRDNLGPKPRTDFDAAINKLLKDSPRSDEVFADLLRTKLAITPNGEHIEGQIGSTQVGMRYISHHDILVESLESIRRRKVLKLPREAGRELIQKRVPYYWPIYAGEVDERLRPGGGAADALPEGCAGMPVGALNMNISAECAILGLDAIVDNLDEGTGAAVIQTRTGAQPADPDAAATGTLLATNVCSATAFGAAADQADGTVDASAAAITDDTSIDATDTAGYCRASATNDGATPLDDHIDGEAGTATADFVFNTVSFVAGATCSITSWVITLDQGTTAT